MAEFVNWICSYCGTRTTMPKGRRPMPGNCLRKGKTKDGKMKPHSWVRG